MAFSALPTSGISVLLGLLRNLARIAPIKQEIIMMSSGSGSGASAIIGAIIVTKRAVTLHVPNTRPKNLGGKNCKVLI